MTKSGIDPSHQQVNNVTRCYDKIVEGRSLSGIVFSPSLQQVSTAHTAFKNQQTKRCRITHH